MPVTGRARGYHYVRLASGRKKRVYSGRKRSNVARKSIPRVRYPQDTIMGFGEYRMKGGTLSQGQIPSIRNSKGGFIIRHKEFVQDISSAQAFMIQGFNINPGNPLLFPWLSKIAGNFEEYKPRGMVMQFKTTSSDAVVSTAANAGLGTVTMATDYNVYNGAFGNKQQMENYEFAVSRKPSMTFLHQVECKRSLTAVDHLYVRTADPPTGADLRLYDMGLFQIARSGMQSNNQVIGELWVSYEFEFLKPKIEIGEPIADNAAADHFDCFTSAIALGSTVQSANPFGNAVTALIAPLPGSNIGGALSGGVVPAASIRGGGVAVLDGAGRPTGALTASTEDTYYFPPGITKGLYLIQYQARYAAAGVQPTIALVTTNCVLKNWFSPADTVSNFTNNTSANTTTVMHSMIINITAGYAKIAFFLGGGPAGNDCTAADFIVSELPGGIL